jgi:2,3-bisphosphoglycerate-independent phosphoglycerate mutase
MPLSLTPLKNFHGRTGPLLLIIMDGIGIGQGNENNAVYLADTPNLDMLTGSRLYTQLKAHGTAVGLPSDKDMGNSEVGHNALGAGRIFEQGASLVNKALETGRVFKTDLWKNIQARSAAGGTTHFIGLLSDGNVHSHIRHLYILLDKCA